jgi:hypothetical protein
MNIVALVIIALDVQTVRTLRGHRKYLQSNIAVGEARNVHVPVGSALQQIAPPEKRVGMKIGDGELFVQIKRPRRRRIRRLFEQLILVLVQQPRNFEEEGDCDAAQYESDLQETSEQKKLLADNVTCRPAYSLLTET